MLPGFEKQFKFLQSKLPVDELNVLVIGASSENSATRILKGGAKHVEIIVEEYNALINSRMILGEDSSVQVKVMDYEVTDYDDNTFYLVFAQGSIERVNRNRIIKEIKRVLKPEGYLCVGETVALDEPLPGFVNDIFTSNNMLVLAKSELAGYYKQRNFKIIDQLDLSDTLKDFYSLSLDKLKQSKKDLTDSEKSYHKKLLNKISHESKAYLEQGGNKFIGFVVSLLQLNK